VKTVVLEVRSLADSLADATHAMHTGQGDVETRIGFSTPELLWQILTANRWELLKGLCGAGPMSVPEIARKLGRNIEDVNADTMALLDAGLLVRSAKGIEFPFDVVKVAFLLKAA
jgi:predicted transcriptional regulator